MNKFIKNSIRIFLISFIFACTPEDPKMNEFSFPFITWSPRTINAGGEVDIGDGSRGVKSRLWTFPPEAEVQFLKNSGSNNSSTERIVYCIFPKPGVFDVRLQTTFNDPSVKLDSLIRITVLELVKARFTSNNQEIRAGESVTFQNVSTGGANLQNWTFAGGTPATATTVNPTVKYNNPGKFDVTLIAFRNAPLSRDTLVVKDYITVLPALE